MTERVRGTSSGEPHPKVAEAYLGPKKTALVLVIVVGCFAVLWPKIFYPMLVGSANQHMKPSPIDKTTGCCDVISEIDVNTIKIMSELCGTITGGLSSGKEIVQRCRQSVLDACGIDISLVLQEQVRLGQNVKQILDEIRSLNGSLCLKYNFGVAPWRLGVPHRVTVKAAVDTFNLRQERPMLRSEIIHPAFRERGRAIPQPQQPPPPRPPKRIVEGRPGPIPGMRPTIGGAGHVVPPPKQGTSSMSVIMPIYTVGIVVFFTYTLMKIIFKKQPETVGGSLYPPIDPDPYFRKEVFDSETSRLGSRLTREDISTKLVVNAMSALLDEVDQEIEARRKINEVASQDLANGNLSNGNAVKPQDEEEQPTVKVLGMETTASCEGGKKWSRPGSPIVPTSPSPPPVEPSLPPQEIYLEGALPPQSQLLVADSAIEPEPATGEDPAVVLSGKMTLSVISPDSENGNEEVTNEPKIVNLVTEKDEENNESSETENTKISFEVQEEKTPSLGMEQDIEAFLEKLRAEVHFEAPTIVLESQDAPQMVEVETLEKEVDQLIQEALDSIKEIETEETTNQKEEFKTDQKSEGMILDDVVETSFDIKNEINDEIQKLIQEVKDLPVLDLMAKQEATSEKPMGLHNQESIEPPVDKNEALEAENREKKAENAPKVEEEIEELIEEIEEIVYEIESGDEEEEEEEEEIEIEVEESDEEPLERHVSGTESGSLPRMNGDRSTDPAEESKYTTVSGGTAAENDISDEELIDEEVEEEEEIMEIEDDEEAPNNKVNNISGDSDQEL